MFSSGAGHHRDRDDELEREMNPADMLLFDRRVRHDYGPGLIYEGPGTLWVHAKGVGLSKVLRRLLDQEGQGHGLLPKEGGR